MKREIDKKIAVIIVLTILLSLFSILVLAEDSPAQQELSNPPLEASQAQQELQYSSANFPYSDTSYFYPSMSDPSNFMTWQNSFCNESTGMDFLIEIPPDACSPTPVPSNLLEEQNVPVLCKMTGIKINPLIEVPYIKKVTPYVKNQSKEIAYVNFYPARSALGTFNFNENFQISQGNPTLNNLGYLLIFLKQQPIEKNMSKNVSVNMVVNITYDVAKTYGIYTQQLTLPILTDAQWEDNYKKYSFWNGRGYMRLQSITGQNAKISVYTKPNSNPLTIKELREGTDFEVKIPGFYCEGPVTVSLDKIQVPGIQARFTINGNDFIFSENEDFADSGCFVNKIETKKYGAGIVHVSCQGHVGTGAQGSYDFVLNPTNAKIKLTGYENADGVEKTVETEDEIILELSKTSKQYYYVGYIGKTADITESQTKAYSYSDSMILFAIKDQARIIDDKEKEKYVAAIQDVIKGKLSGGLNRNTILAEVNKDIRVNGAIKFINVLKTASPSVNNQITQTTTNTNTASNQNLGISIGAGAPDLIVTSNAKITLLSVEGPVQVSYSSEIESEYKKVISYYKEIASQYPTQNSQGEVYGIVSLRAAANLAGYMSKQNDQIELLQLIIDKYSDIDDEYIQAQVEQARLDILSLSQTSGDRSQLISTDAGTYQATLISINKPGLNVKEAKLKINNADAGTYLVGDMIGDLLITDITDQGISLDVPGALPDFVKTGSLKIIHTTRIEVINTLVKKEVKVTVHPLEKERTTMTNFSVVIGITKRSIQLTPSQINKRIIALNKTIDTLNKYVDILEKTTTTWKKACYAGGAVLWAKNFISGMTGQSLARRFVMKAWSSKCASEEYRTTLGGDKRIASLSECYKTNQNGIEKDVNAVTGLMNQANAFIKQIKSKDGVVVSSGMLGLSKQINEEKFIAEAKNLFLNDAKYSSLIKDVSVKVELGKLTAQEIIDLREAEQAKPAGEQDTSLITLLSIPYEKLTKANKETLVEIPLDAEKVMNSLDEVIYKKFGKINSDDVKDLFVMLSIYQAHKANPDQMTDVLNNYNNFNLFTKFYEYNNLVKKVAFSTAILKDFGVKAGVWSGPTSAEKAITVAQSEINSLTSSNLIWFDDEDKTTSADTTRKFLEADHLNKVDAAKEFIIFNTDKHEVLGFLEAVGNNQYKFVAAYQIHEVTRGNQKFISIDRDTGGKIITLANTKDETVLPSYVILDTKGECSNEVNPSDYKIRFWEKGTYEGQVAQMIISRTEGWYFATKAYTGLQGELTAYKETGQVNEYWICNVGPNGKPEFNFYSGVEGDDGCCFEISKTRNMEIPDKIAALAKQVEEKCLPQAQQSYAKKERPIKTGSCGNTQPLGQAPALISSTQCEDFMSPEDCSIMFNLCDPVMCPPSRCDLGGRFPVENVAQSGIIGSLVLCLNNYREVAVPICITGLYNGLDALNNMVFKTYKECLQKQLDTGQTTGICDYMHSVYFCQILWGNLDPFIKAGIPLITESFSQGGGEYSLFSEAVKSAENSMNYFTQYYGPNAFSSFKERATNQTGKMICDKYVSIVYPTAAKFAEDLTKADSYYSLTATIEEIPFTSSPESQYRVFYDIYAGRDSPVSYYVYIKKPATLGYETTLERLFVRNGQGFLSPGQTKVDTVDFTAPAGYTEVCVNINGQDKCFKGSGSTSFAIQELQNYYLEDQIKKNIKTEIECSAGKASLVPVPSLNLQTQVQSQLQPAVYKRGIIRICASDDPGAGTEQTDRYKKVGYCDNPSVGCWLDMNTVNDSISDLGMVKDIYNYTNDLALKELQKEGLVDIPSATEGKLSELNKKLNQYREVLYGPTKNVEDKAGIYNTYLTRIHDLIFTQLDFTSKPQLGGLDSVKNEIRAQQVLTNLSALAIEAERVSSRALSAKDKAEVAWIKAQALDERLRFLALTDIVSAGYATSETCTDQDGIWTPTAKLGDCPPGTTWIQLTSDQKTTDKGFMSCCKGQTAAVLSEDCVTQVNALMQAADYIRAHPEARLAECTGRNCGTYVWNVYRIAKLKFGLVGVDWPDPEPQNVKSAKIVMEKDDFSKNDILPGDLILYYQNGANHINIVGIPDGSGKFYDIDSIYKEKDPTDSSVPRYPDYFDMKGQYSGDGTWYEGLTRVFRIIPACMSYSNSLQAGQNSQVPTSASQNVDPSTPSPEIDFVMKGNTPSFYAKFNGNTWTCFRSSDYTSYNAIPCSRVNSWSTSWAYSSQQNEIAKALANSNKQQGYDYLINTYKDKKLVSDITYKDNGQDKPITQIYSYDSKTQTTPSTTPTTPTTQPSVTGEITLNTVAKIGDEKYIDTKNSRGYAEYAEDARICAVITKDGQKYSSTEVSGDNDENIGSWAGTQTFTWSLIRAYSRHTGWPDSDWPIVPSSSRPTTPWSGYQNLQSTFLSMYPSPGQYEDVIQYQQTVIRSGNDAWCIDVEKKPGAYFYRVAVTYNQKLYSSPGKPVNIDAETLSAAEKFYPSVYFDSTRAAVLKTLIEPSSYNHGIVSNINSMTSNVVPGISRLSDYSTTTCLLNGYSSSDAECRFISIVESFKNVPFIDAASESDTTSQPFDFVGVDCLTLPLASIGKTQDNFYNIPSTYEEFIGMQDVNQVLTLNIKGTDQKAENVLFSDVLGSGILVDKDDEKAIHLGDLFVLYENGKPTFTMIYYNAKGSMVNGKRILSRDDIAVYVSDVCQPDSDDQLCYGPIGDYAGYHVSILRPILS